MYTFATVPELPRSDWLDGYFMSLLYENLVLEERTDIRTTSFTALEAALNESRYDASGELEADIESHLQDWYSLVMIPVGAEMHHSYFSGKRKAPTGHDIDKHMMAGDMTILSPEFVMQTRLAGAMALAKLRMVNLSEEVSAPAGFSMYCGIAAKPQVEDGPHVRKNVLDHNYPLEYLDSTSAHQVYMAATIISIWSEKVYQSSASGSPDFESPEQRDPQFKALSDKLISLMERGAPPTYAEMGTLLKRIQGDCQALLSSFKEIGRVSKDRIPDLPQQIDPLKTTSDFFSLNTAHMAVTTHFNALSKLLPKGSAKTTLPQLQEKQRKVMASIGRYSVMKERYDVQVSSGVAGALVSMRVLPPKLGAIVKAIMESIKVSCLEPGYYVVEADPAEGRESHPAKSLSIIHRLLPPFLHHPSPSRTSQPHRQSRPKPHNLPLPRYIHQSCLCPHASRLPDRHSFPQGE